MDVDGSVLRRIKKALAISYADLVMSDLSHNYSLLCTHQQMAVLGIVVIIRGFSPRK